MNRSRKTGDLVSQNNLFVDIANDRVGIGSTIPGNKLSLPDSAKIGLGNAEDLTVVHDGNNSTISNSTGGLYLQSDTSINIDSKTGSHQYIHCTKGAEVSLWHNNSKKLETRSGGVTVTGGLNLSGELLNNDHIQIQADSKHLIIGAGDDLRAYHNGSNSIVNNNTGTLFVQSDNITFKDKDDGDVHAKFIHDGACELYYNNAKTLATNVNRLELTGNASECNTFYYTSDGTRRAALGITNSDSVTMYPGASGIKAWEYASNALTLYHTGNAKLSTDSGGVSVTGRVFASGNAGYGFLVDDNVKIAVGTGKDLAFYHDGSFSRIKDSGTNALIIQSSEVRIQNEAANETMAIFISDGASELYHNNAKKLETTSSGATVTGTLTATTFSGALTGTLQTAAQANVTSLGTLTGLTVSGDVSIADKIVHTGDTNTAIRFPDADKITFETGGTERLRIADTQVGIKDVPLQILRTTVSGNSDLNFGDSADSDTGQIRYRHDDNFMSFTVNTTERLRIDSSGRVIITNDGVTNPTGTNTQYAPLVVRGNTSATSSRSGWLTLARSEASANISADEGIGEIWFGDQQAGEYGAIKCFADAAAAVGDYPGRLSFWTTADGGTTMYERLRITSGGEVGIGITNPDAYEGNGNNLVVGDTTSHNGITILTGTDKDGRLGFADGTGAASYRGMIEYQHGTGTAEFMKIVVAGDEALRITSAGELLLGATASAMVGGGAASLYQIETTSQNALSCVAHRGTGNTSGSIFILGKSRGTSAGSVTVVADNDQLGAIRFAGADGTDIQSRGGEISCSVDGTPGSNDMPGRLMFSTTADGASTPTERLRIHSGGQVSIGSATEGHADADELTLAGTRTGLTIRSASDNYGNIFFSDATTGADEYVGAVQYYHADNSLRFKTSSTDRLLITSDGKLGIGVNSPSTAMHLKASDAYFTMQASSSSGNAGILFKDSGGTQNSVILYDFDDDYLKITTNNDTERLRIASDGQLRIGTTSTGTASVIIDSTLGSGSALRFIGKSANGGSEIDFYANNNSTRLGYIEFNDEVTKIVSETDVPFKITTNGGSNERLRITSAGRVNIGQASDVDHTLCVAGTDNTTSLTGGHSQGIQLQNKSTTDGTYSQIEWRTSSGGRYARIAGIQDDANGNGGQLVFLTETSGGTTTEALRITSGDVVSFGNSSPPAWQTGGGYYNIQLGNAGYFRSDTDASTNFLSFGLNAYRDGSGWKFIEDGRATQVSHQAGDIFFNISNSGNADGAITFTEALRITSAGKIGIGIAAPLHNLHIKPPSASETVLKIESESGYDARLKLDTSSGGGAEARIDFEEDASIRGWISYTNNSGGTTDDMVFGTATSERLRITSSGRSNFKQDNGSTNNAYAIVSEFNAKTSGSAAANFGPALYLSHTFGGTNYAGSLITSQCDADVNTTHISFYPRNYGWTEALRITATGKVGIKNTNPSEMLQIGDGSGTTGGLKVAGQSSSVTDDGLTLDWTASNEARLFSESSGNSTMQFYTTNSGTRGERLRIDSTGKVGINQTDIDADLHIATAGSSEQHGTLKIGGSENSLGLSLTYDQSSATVSKITANPTYSHNSSLLKICVDGDGNPDQLVLNGAGKIGINIADNTSADLQVRTGTNGAGVFRLGGGSGNGIGMDMTYSNSGTTSTIFRQNYLSTNSDALMQFDSGYFTFRTGTSPTEKLRITSGGDVYFAGNQSGNNRGIIYNHADGFGFYASASSGVNRDIRFYSNGASSSERLRIEDDGIVKLGFVDATYLHIPSDERLISFDVGQKMFTSNDGQGNFNMICGANEDNQHVNEESGGHCGIVRMTLNADGQDGDWAVGVGPNRSAGSAANVTRGIRVEYSASGMNQAKFCMGDTADPNGLATQYPIIHRGNALDGTWANNVGDGFKVLGDGGSIAITTNDGGGNCNLCFNCANQVADTAGSAWRIRCDIDAANSHFLIRNNTSVSSGGSVASMTTRLEISESGTFSGSSSNNISDQRLKKNIATITNATATIKALTGRTFEWKDGVQLESGTQYGFIAQEMESVVSDLVTDGTDTGIRAFDKDGNILVDNKDENAVEYSKAVNIDGVIPILVEALKESITKIETLETKNSQLITLLDELKVRLDNAGL